MSAILSGGAGSEVPFTYTIERADGRTFTYNYGSSSLNTVYESASTSKLVTSTIILRLVEQGALSLSDKPQTHIPSWPLGSGDSLYNMTLSHLLSFRSGMTDELFCLHSGVADFETCTKNMAANNAGNGNIPGNLFYYSGVHMQVAGLMAQYASSAASWQDIFGQFKTATGLFTNATYDLPSATNPRLGGGMRWTATEYMNFLRALKNGTLLNTSSMNELLKDHTASSQIVYSPPKTDLNEEWHYGLGIWHECQNSTYNCNSSTGRVSSPGAYGSYPFWDRTKNYFGIVARQGASGTYPKGIQIERSVRSKAELWATCAQ
ncbi:serine hydrolase domain-containing protein [Bdellovibrio bacteriovorus]|uniref:serine hydrolase domain-containing protein n=1 Tax=Bdellovibrio TaxID=958 RepID=UPI0035A88611